jgi:hypothetical protein
MPSAFVTAMAVGFAARRRLSDFGLFLVVVV